MAAQTAGDVEGEAIAERERARLVRPQTVCHLCVGVGAVAGQAAEGWLRRADDSKVWYEAMAARTIAALV